MSSTLEHAYAVVLAGGSGTRLWPMSRDGQPKQFLKLGGDRTLLQQCIDRIQPLIPVDRIIVVTGKDYSEVVRQQLPELDPRNIIAEPEKRDTALAMALGSLVAKKRDPEAVVTNLASDHVFKDLEEYRRVLQTSFDLASQKDALVTVGIKPLSPNVNFGYIQVGELQAQQGGHKIYKVLSFKEKPAVDTAQQFLAAGNYYWNANMYTWHVETMLEAFRLYRSEQMPELDRLFAALDTPDQETTLVDVYSNAEKISIDYAISEHAKNLILIPGDFGWDDIGLWSTVYDLGTKDENGQVVVQDQTDQTPILSLDSHNNLIATNGRLVALLGIQDMVVVDSEGVLLIAPLERASEVKNMVNALKERGLQEYL